MAEQKLKGLRVAILATDGFEQVELVEPRKALQEAGGKTTVIAPKSGKIQGMKHHEKADQVEVDRTLDKAKAADFDAMLLPGGALNADALRVEKGAQAFAQEMEEAGKPIAVICHGSWLLASAGLVKGHTLTSYHTIQDDIRKAGGQWVNDEVVHDQNWVSSRQPSDIPAFNRAMISLFADRSMKTKNAA